MTSELGHLWPFGCFEKLFKLRQASQTGAMGSCIGNQGGASMRSLVERSHRVRSHLSLHCLANVSILPADAPKCDFSMDPCPMGQACVAMGPQGQLRCHQATVKYVPSYSTKFECQVSRVVTGLALRCQEALRCCTA